MVCMANNNDSKLSIDRFRNRVYGRARILVIAALGWEPEPRCTVQPENCDRENCYAATLGELLSYLRETDRALADRIDECAVETVRAEYERRRMGTPNRAQTGLGLS